MAITIGQIQGTLRKYPNLYSLPLDYKKIMSIPQSIDEEFTFRDILARENEVYWENFLKKLDGLVVTTKKIFKNSTRLSCKIVNAPFSTCWELEIAQYFIDRGISTSPEPKTTGGSVADFLLSLEGKKIFVEAYVRRFKGTEERCGSGDITRGLVNTLIEKLNRNGIKLNFLHPVIMAIDGDYASIDRINVETTFDAAKTELSHISGILLKQSSLGCHYQFIPNPYSSHKLDCL